MAESIDIVLARVVEILNGKHFGKYRGIVREIDATTGKIRAEMDNFFDDGLCPWATPCVPFAGPKHGLVLMPEQDDGVWIEFEAGNLANPIWSGCWWADDELPEPNAHLSRLLATKKGHKILIDDDADEIRLTHAKGAEIVLGAKEISLVVGQCSIKITKTEITINDGMAKLTKAGASLVNDAFKVGG
jgi:hypothetical protein